MDETIDVLARDVKQLNNSAHDLGYFNKAVKDYFNQKICEYEQKEDFDGLSYCKEDFKKMYEFQQRYDK